MAVTYSFRNRLVLSGGVDTRLPEQPIGVTRVVLFDGGPDGVVELFGPGEGDAIRDALELRLRGRNFPTAEAADAAGRVWRNHLTIAFAHLLVGVRIGPVGSPPHYGFGTPYYQNPERRLRENPGLHVFKTDSEPGPSGGYAEGRVLQGLHGLVTYTLPWITRREYDLSPQHSLAYVLVHAAYFEDNPETAFIVLVTAIEALLPAREDNPRDVAKVIDSLLDRLSEIIDIDPDLQRDVAQALEDDKFDSIGRRGRMLVSCLGSERFAGQKPKDYFTQRYQMRSELVHGSVNRPSDYQLEKELRELRRFVLALLGVQVFGERMPEQWTADTVAGT